MSGHPVIVVMGVDVPGRAFFEADAEEVLRLWRDGVVRPAVCRALVVRYVRLLKRLGLKDALIRRWVWWWGAPEKSVYVDVEIAGRPVLGEVYRELARLTNARWVVYGGPGPAPRVDVAPAEWASLRTVLDEFDRS